MGLKRKKYTQNTKQSGCCPVLPLSSGGSVNKSRSLFLLQPSKTGRETLAFPYKRSRQTQKPCPKTNPKTTTTKKSTKLQKRLGNKQKLVCFP